MPEPVIADSYTGPRYRYGLTNRPAAYANVPDEWIIGSERKHPDFPHGTIDYPRELSGAQCSRFELTPFPVLDPFMFEQATLELRGETYEFVIWQGGGYTHISAFKFLPNRFPKQESRYHYLGDGREHSDEAAYAFAYLLSDLIPKIWTR